MKKDKNVSLKIGKHKDREGGLTKAGVEKYNKETGSNLQTGVKGKPKTPEDYRRKGSFLTRFYNRKDIPPLKKPSGKPTRFALAAAAWGEPVPSSMAAVKRLASKGKSLLAQYEQMMERKKKQKKQKLSQNGNAFVEYADNVLKVPLAMIGEFQHSVYPEVKFDSEDFKSTINNFKNKVLGFTPYITYGHLKDNNFAVDAELKKGNCLDMQVDDEILYGFFDSSPEAYEYVVKGEYEYNSGEFIRNFKDKITGENLGTVLARTALTNSPFLPFNEHKVEALSQTELEKSNLNLFQILPIEFKNQPEITLESNNNDYLLQDKNIITKDNKENNLKSMPQDLEEKTVETTSSSESTTPVEDKTSIDDIVKNVLEKIQNQIPPAYKTADETPVVEESVEEKEEKVEAVNITEKEDYKNIADIVSSVTNSLTESFKTQLNEIKLTSTETIQELKNQIGELTDKLGKQEQVSQAFSNSLSEQQRKERYSKFADSGMSPSFIQKFSQIENALESGNNIIKLSNSEGKEIETSVSTLIAETIIEALKAEPVELQQFGQSNNQQTGMVADIKNLITENKEKAKKLNLN